MRSLDILANLLHEDVEQRPRPSGSLKERLCDGGSKTSVYYLNDHRKPRVKGSTESLAAVYNYLQEPLQHRGRIRTLTELQRRVDRAYEHLEQAYSNPQTRDIVSRDYVMWKSLLEQLRGVETLQDGVVGLELLDRCIALNRIPDIGDAAREQIRRERDLE